MIMSQYHSWKGGLASSQLLHRHLRSNKMMNLNSHYLTKPRNDKESLLTKLLAI